jgi:hypothetical protein
MNLRTCTIAPLILAAACTYELEVGDRQLPLAAAEQVEQGAVDILFVIDSSGSMCEEQASLASSFYDPDCPIDDLMDVPDALLQPNPGVLEALTPVCGFSQILAAYDRDFRVGVVTTDVSDCDNDYDQAASNVCDFATVGAATWGRRPQRGCLVAPPGATKKFVERSDVDVVPRFIDTLQSVGTFGTAYERGMDAAQAFLDPSIAKAPGCADDAASFLRDDARLLVVFVTDEDDCSHDADAFGYDPTGQDDCSVQASNAGTYDATDCYTRRELLAPVDRYADFLRGLKGPGRAGDVQVAVIAGGVYVEQDKIVAAGCRAGALGIDALCTTTDGNSMNPTLCDPDVIGEDTPCCTADPGRRYFELQSAVAASPDAPPLTESICAEQYQDAMVAFVAATEHP